MKKYFLVIAVVFIGCKNFHNEPPAHLIRSFKNTGNWDSAYLYSDGHLKIIPKKDLQEEIVQEGTGRFLLISYTTKLKNDSKIIYGNMWFSAAYFPTKNEIDSLAFSGLPKVRSCYQHIIITSIYEFKNGLDFERFRDNYNDTDIIPSVKLKCK